MALKNGEKISFFFSKSTTASRALAVLFHWSFVYFCVIVGVGFVRCSGWLRDVRDKSFRGALWETFELRISIKDVTTVNIFFNDGKTLFLKLFFCFA